jgi:hypothetical protein
VTIFLDLPSIISPHFTLNFDAGMRILSPMNVLTTRGKLLWVFLFTTAMAYIESAVVVYLREIYYPHGFEFPLEIAPLSGIIAVEIGREASTILILAAIGFFNGRTRLERLAYTMIAFGLWDVFYYVWLKVFINWPPALLTWDVLFLIPLPWVSPVLAPVLVSLALIGAGLGIIRLTEKGITLRLTALAWAAEIAAGLVIILSFLLDVKNISEGGYPNPFNWWVFSIGLGGGLGIFIYCLNRRSPQI